MKFMVSWTIRPQHRKETTSRFLQTGGSPPAGVKMLGRWHGPHGGFALAETNDGKALYDWAAHWCDLLEIDISPVVEDGDAADVMKRLPA
jgi:hypothetical protein